MQNHARQTISDTVTHSHGNGMAIVWKLTLELNLNTTCDPQQGACMMQDARSYTMRVLTWICCASDCLGTTMKSRDRGGRLSGSQLISWSSKGLAGVIPFLLEMYSMEYRGGSFSVTGLKNRKWLKLRFDAATSESKDCAWCWRLQVMFVVSSQNQLRFRIVFFLQILALSPQQWLASCGDMSMPAVALLSPVTAEFKSASKQLGTLWGVSFWSSGSSAC